jgi:hypothetical protein
MLDRARLADAAGVLGETQRGEAVVDTFARRAAVLRGGGMERPDAARAAPTRTRALSSAPRRAVNLDAGCEVVLDGNATTARAASVAVHGERGGGGESPDAPLRRPIDGDVGRACWSAAVVR